MKVFDLNIWCKICNFEIARPQNLARKQLGPYYPQKQLNFKTVIQISAMSGFIWLIVFKICFKQGYLVYQYAVRTSIHLIWITSGIIHLQSYLLFHYSRITVNSVHCFFSVSHNSTINILLRINYYCWKLIIMRCSHMSTSL